MSISDAERPLIETIKTRQAEIVAIERVLETLKLTDPEGHDIIKFIWYDLKDECHEVTKELIRIRKDRERKRYR